MAFYRTNHPWNPGYALSRPLLQEPAGRGALVTKPIPRRTIDAPKVGSGGYALPKYVATEPLGQGARVTKQLPRRTVGALAPDYLARRGKKDSKLRLKGLGSLGCTSLAGTSLGDLAVPFVSPPSDPIGAYGDKAARLVVSRLMALPAEFREPTLKAILSSVDPSLWRTVATKLPSFTAGHTQWDALRRALSQSFSEGVAKEIVKLGRGRRGKAPLLGLGAFPDISKTIAEAVNKAVAAKDRGPRQLQIKGLSMPYTTDVWYLHAPGGHVIANHSVRAEKVVKPKDLPLAFRSRIDAIAKRLKAVDANKPIELWDDLRPKAPGVETKKDPHGHVIYKHGYLEHAVWIAFPEHTELKDWKRAKAIGVVLAQKPKPNILERFLSSLAAAFKALFKMAVEIVETVAEAAKDVVDKLGEAACDLVNSDIAPIAGAGAAAAYGAPPETGAAGVGIAQGMCGKGGTAPPPPTVVQQSSILPWALLGGGVIVLVLAVK